MILITISMTNDKKKKRVDNMQRQMGKINREMKTLKKNITAYYRNQTVSEMKNDNNVAKERSVT